MGGNKNRWQVAHVMETILLLDADDSTRQALKIMFKLHGYRVVEALTGLEALQILGEWKEELHLAVCAEELPDMTTGQWRGQMRFLGMDIPSLVLTERERFENADFPIEKGFSQANTRLLEKIRLALDERFFSTIKHVAAA